MKLYRTDHSFSMSLVGGIINSWLILMYWLSKFFNYSFWLCSYPVSLMNFWRDCNRSWYLDKDLSKVFQTLKVLSGKAWVIFYQYFLPSLAIKSFFSLSDNCLIDLFVVLSSIFFLSSLVFIHSTRKSTTRTGSTLKSLLRSTLASSTSTGSTFSIFFSSPFLFFLAAFSSYSLCSCYLLSFSSCWVCFSFSLTYLHLFAISSKKRFSS